MLRVRSLAKRAAVRQTPAAKKTSTAKPAGKSAGAPPKTVTPTANAARAISKSDFIRSQPATLNAVEVVAAAKTAGIKLDSYLVYKVRAALRDKAGKGAAKKTSPAKPSPKPTAKKGAPARGAATPAAEASAPTAPHAARHTPATSHEELLRAVASEIGLARAIGVLEEQRRQVLRVLGG